MAIKLARDVMQGDVVLRGGSEHLVTESRRDPEEERTRLYCVRHDGKRSLLEYSDNEAVLLRDKEE